MATGATEFIDSTTADVFIPEMWSQQAIVVRENQLVYAQLVDRRFEDNLTFGDTIHVPSVGNLAARTKTKASNAAITFETVTETNTDITIATWEYAAIGVESIVKVQNNRDQLKLYAGKMGYALALAVDDVLAGYPDNATNSVGALASENTYAELTRARQYIRDADAPMSGLRWVFSPAAENGLIQLDRFTRDDYAAIHGPGARETALEQAYMTSFLRIPIYISTNTEGSNSVGHDNTLFHTEAFALVMQMKPTPHSMYDINYLVDKVVLEQLYGSAIMRDNHSVWVKGA